MQEKNTLNIWLLLAMSICLRLQVGQCCCKQSVGVCFDQHHKRRVCTSTFGPPRMNSRSSQVREKQLGAKNEPVGQSGSRQLSFQASKSRLTEDKVCLMT